MPPQNSNGHYLQNGSGNRAPLVCHNCEREGHIARQCEQPGRGRGRLWQRNGDRPQHHGYNHSSSANTLQNGPNGAGSQLNANVAPFVPHHRGPYGHMNLGQDRPWNNAAGAQINGNGGSHNGGVTGHSPIIPADTADSAPALTVFAPNTNAVPSGPLTAPFTGGAFVPGSVPGSFVSPMHLASPEYARTVPNTPRNVAALAAPFFEAKSRGPRLVQNHDPQADSFPGYQGVRSISPLDALTMALADVSLSSRNTIEALIATIDNSLSTAQANHHYRGHALIEKFAAVEDKEKTFEKAKGKALELTIACLEKALSAKGNEDFVEKHRETAVKAMRIATENSVGAMRERRAVEDIRKEIDELKSQQIKDLENVLGNFVGVMKDALKACDAEEKMKNATPSSSTKNSKDLCMPAQTQSGKGRAKLDGAESDKENVDAYEKSNDVKIIAMAVGKDNEQDNSKRSDNAIGEVAGKSNGDDATASQEMAPKKPSYSKAHKNNKKKTNSKAASMAISDAETEATEDSRVTKDTNTAAKGKDVKGKQNGAQAGDNKGKKSGPQNQEVKDKKNESANNDSANNKAEEKTEGPQINKANGSQAGDAKGKKNGAQDQDTKEMKSGPANGETKEKNTGPQPQKPRYGRSKKNGAKNKDTAKDADTVKTTDAGKSTDAVKTNEAGKTKGGVNNSAA